MHLPKISIVMPAYNAEQFILKAIKSVVQQTYEDWELIVVDDGSTDTTADIIKSLSKNDSRIKYYYQNNKKQAAARNLGVSHCVGEWIGFFDADDIWKPTKLEVQMKCTIEVAADIFYTCGDVIDERDNFLFDLPTKYGMWSANEMYKQLYKLNVIPIISVLAKAECLKKAGLFDEDQYIMQWCEDWDYWIRLADLGAIFYGIDEKLFLYRINPNGTSRDKIRMDLGGALVLIKNFKKEKFSKVEIDSIFKPLIPPLLFALLKDNKLNEASVLMKNFSKKFPAFLNKLNYLLLKSFKKYSVLPIKAVNRIDALTNKIRL